METTEATETRPADHFRNLTPPTSEDMDNHKAEVSSSELSELEDDDDDDIGEVEPDHYWDGGRIPVFKPTMDQFRSFKKYVDKIDKYGMKSGIVKVIPPPEWRNALPDLKDVVKTIKVKNPITQEFAGHHGTYTQANIEKQRTYNLPQWKALTEEHHHQPPAKRGERKRVDAPTRPRPVRTHVSNATSAAERRSRGRPRKKLVAQKIEEEEDAAADADGEAATSQVPPTPTSADNEPVKSENVTPSSKRKKKTVLKSVEEDAPSKPKGRQPKAKSISSRRMNNRQEAGDDIDEEAFRDFDYHLEDIDEYTAERCKDLEEVYWKTVNYGTPMYGADMPGSLFDDTTTSWNVAHLENLLDVLGTKVPGVNTAYLYLGMWKATFAWHLEDVDLYSINYIHFGAPKQWYSISQEDARRFETAMKSIWPHDAKHCDQFLRHKTYLISPDKLKSQFNITVNKLVHYEGEFVITYPYGYHSGFNLGYNCAESVNFATDAWLNYGRIAKKCDCEPDSVWVDVNEVERKLRGEPTPEYYEETDEEEDEGDEPTDLPSPPESLSSKTKTPSRKRKRDTMGKGAAGPKTKKIKIRVKIPSREPCILCPNDVAFDVLLPTDNGKQAHRLCALYTPETFLIEKDGVERICNVAHIDKARLDLKCNFCRSKRGACFQCSSKKCTRAYHATCAAAAGVQIDSGPVPTWDEDGTEYYCEGYDFRCRFHRPKRPKNITLEALEDNKLVNNYAKDVKPKQVVQALYFTGEVFAGTVIENRPEERSVHIKVLPEGDEVELEWKWLLALDPAHSLRPKPSATAKPLPEHLENNAAVNSTNQKDAPPQPEEPFNDPNAGQKWAEFHTCTTEEARNPNQVKIDMDKPERVWHYLGKTSTEARPQYTHDPKISKHNPKSNFVDTVKPQPKSQVAAPRRSYPASYPTGSNTQAANAAMAVQRQQQMQAAPIIKQERPYQYRPKTEVPRPNIDPRTYQYTLDGQRHHISSPTLQRPRQASIDATNRGVHGYSAAHQYYSQGNPRPASQDRPRSHLPQQLLGHPYSQLASQQSSTVNRNPGPPSQSPRQPSQSHVYDPIAEQRRQSHSSPYSAWQPPYQPAGQAPVANMGAPVADMGGKSAPLTALSPTGYQPPSYSMPYKTPAGVNPAAMSAVDYMVFLRQYPYLLEAHLRRPKRYESPYALKGGFSPAYMPISPKPELVGCTQQTPPYYGAPQHTQLRATNEYDAKFQYQTPQQFHQQVLQERSKPPGMEKYEKLAAQLQGLGSRKAHGHNQQPPVQNHSNPTNDWRRNSSYSVGLALPPIPYSTGATSLPAPHPPTSSPSNPNTGAYPASSSPYGAPYRHPTAPSTNAYVSQYPTLSGVHTPTPAYATHYSPSPVTPNPPVRRNSAAGPVDGDRVRLPSPGQTKSTTYPVTETPVNRSPIRPEYSPLSDAGGFDTPGPPVPMAPMMPQHGIGPLWR